MSKASVLTVLIVVAIFLPSSATMINIPDDYLTIQEGIDASSDSDTVLVQPDTYYENINFNGHNIVLGSLYLTTEDTSYISQTSIDGDSSGSVVILENNEDSTAVITGFTIQNGLALYGGGIFCWNSSVKILGNIIRGNYAVSDIDSNGHGGGIYCMDNDYDVEVKIEICRNKIIENIAVAYPFREGYGGGIFCDRTDAVINENIISHNFSTGTGSGGGGICASNSDALIEYNIINDNVADRGSGIYCVYNSDSEIHHNLIFNNLGGGIACLNNSHANIVNNTIFENVLAGGIMAHTLSYPTVRNNIIRNNHEFEIYAGGPGVPIVEYNNVLDGWEGEGNIDVDPLFRNPENDDFHLMATYCDDPYDSPCIDAGHPDILDSLLDCDWGLGEVRSDMGAYGGGDSTQVGIDDRKPQLPRQFALSQNYPNPFNASTAIGYTLPYTSDVTLDIYDILGRKVETLHKGNQPAGSHSVIWNADGYSSGVYFYKLQAGDYTETKKMVLLK